MIQCLYHVVETTVSDECGIPHTRYGIAATMSMADIFGHRESAERLAELCNNMKLSLLHFQEVIEDALIEEHT